MSLQNMFGKSSKNDAEAFAYNNVGKKIVRELRYNGIINGIVIGHSVDDDFILVLTDIEDPDNKYTLENKPNACVIDSSLLKDGYRYYYWEVSWCNIHSEPTITDEERELLIRILEL